MIREQIKTTNIFCLIADMSVFSTSGQAPDESGVGQVDGLHRDEAQEEKNASNCP